MSIRKNDDIIIKDVSLFNKTKHDFRLFMNKYEKYIILFYTGILLLLLSRIDLPLSRFVVIMSSAIVAFFCTIFFIVMFFKNMGNKEEPTSEEKRKRDVYDALELQREEIEHLTVYDLLEMDDEAREIVMDRAFRLAQHESFELFE